jgi:methylisocitrate lyase
LMAGQVASAGSRLRSALEEERPLQIVGVINAYAALIAERVGFRALYLSGAGVANYQHGMPDLGLTTLNDVLEEVQIRDELYDFLRYHEYEEKLDRLFAGGREA